MSSELLGHCPVHPDSETLCRCCTGAVGLDDILRAEDVGVGLWRCANWHVIVGTPLMYNGSEDNMCEMCGEPLVHLASGVFKRRGEEHAV